MIGFVAGTGAAAGDTTTGLGGGGGGGTAGLTWGGAATDVGIGCGDDCGFWIGDTVCMIGGTVTAGITGGVAGSLGGCGGIGGCGGLGGIWVSIESLMKVSPFVGS